MYSVQRQNKTKTKQNEQILNIYFKISKLQEQEEILYVILSSFLLTATILDLDRLFSSLSRQSVQLLDISSLYWTESEALHSLSINERCKESACEIP